MTLKSQHKLAYGFKNASEKQNKGKQKDKAGEIQTNNKQKSFKEAQIVEWDVLR